MIKQSLTLENFVRQKFEFVKNHDVIQQIVFTLFNHPKMSPTPVSNKQVLGSYLEIGSNFLYPFTFVAFLYRALRNYYHYKYWRVKKFL